MYVDVVRYRLIYRSGKGVGLAVDNDLNLVGSVLGKLKCAVVETGFLAVDDYLFKAYSFIEAVAESGRNGSHDNEGSLRYVIERISHLNGVLTGLGDLRSFLVFDHVSVLGYDDLSALVCLNGNGVGKTAIVYVDSKINRLIDLKSDFSHVLCLIGYANYVFTLIADGSTRYVLANLFSVLDKNSGCFLVKNVNGYRGVYGKVCLVSLRSYLGRFGVDDKLVSALCTVKVLKYDGVRSVCGKLVAGLVLDFLAILSHGNLCFILPSEGNFLVGMTAVFNACKVAGGCGLSVGDLTCDRIHSGTELVGNDDLIHTAGSELIHEVVELNSRSVVVCYEGFPSAAAIGGLVDLKSLEVRFLILALGNSDHKLFLCLVCLEVNGGGISGDHDLECLGLTNVVYCYCRVGTAFTELADLTKAEATDKLSVFIIYVEHCHLIQSIGDRNADLVLEVVGTLKIYLYRLAFTNCIEELGKCADYGNVILAGIAVGIGNCHYVLTLGVINAAYKGLTVNGNANVLTDYDLVCEDIAVSGITVKILTGACGCGSLLPIVVVNNAVLCVLSDYLVKTLNGKVSYKLIGIARLIVNEVGSVLCVCRVNGVHRNTRIPSGVVPLSSLYLGVFACGCKFKSLFIGGKSEGIAIDIGCLEVFLHKSIREDVLLGRYELGLPLVACHIYNLNNILSGIDGVNGRTVGDCLAVYGYGLDGSEAIGIAIRPRDHNVAIGASARYIGDVDLLAGTVDNNRVLSGRVACCVNTVEYVLAYLVELGTRYVAYERGSAGHLHVAGFVTLEGDVLCIGVSATADHVIIRPKLCIGSLSVNSDGVSV